MALEVVIHREDSCPDQFLLEDADVVQKVFRPAAADIVDGIGGIWKSVFSDAFLRCSLHDPVKAFDDIIDVGEVAAHVPVIENPDRLTGCKPPGGAVIEHVGSSRRPIDSEESEACGGDVVKLAVGVGKQLIALFGGGIEADGMIHLVIRAERDLLVPTVDG